jgi:type III restriction enzyme
LVDLEVPHKDKRATQWCKDTTSLTGENWSYMRVNQEDFERYRFKSIKELILALKR